MYAHGGQLVNVTFDSSCARLGKGWVTTAVRANQGYLAVGRRSH